MYEYIKGKVAYKQTDYIVIEVQGVGYRIFSSLGTIASVNENSEAVIYTHLHVREDAMVLYGFSTKQELNIFEMLISISGIGPKAALSLLSIFTPQAIALNIASNNINELSKASGIGKKTAMRIVLELKDKFKNLEIKEAEEYEGMECTSETEEAKTALMVLGFNSKQACQAVNMVYDKEDKLEMIIRKALNHLNGGK